MPGIPRVSVPILDPQGGEVGALILHCLPGQEKGREFPLWDVREDWSRDQGLEPFQVVEGTEYRFEIRLGTDQPVRTDRPEVLAPDDHSGLAGRFRPGLHTGLLPVRFFRGEDWIGRASVEVRSVKLDYLRHYRWMLEDIAAQVAEIVIQSFAPAMQRFEPDPARDPATLYQRFAFLRALITSEEFEAALAGIFSSPDRTWAEELVPQSPGRGLRPGSGILGALTAPGPRQPWPGSPLAALPSLPVTVLTRRWVESLDTAANRFVKFALGQWQTLVATVDEQLRRAKRTGSVERGLREVREVLGRLDAALGHEVFREVGELGFFPGSSSVLNRGTGYREMLRWYFQSEAAARLSWGGGEDVYGAGQRNVATLYEYWAFLNLAEIVARLCDAEPIDLSGLVEPTANGLALRLRKGQRLVLQGRASRGGRDLALTLYFNRAFTPLNRDPDDGSWSRVMQPDSSLRITASPNRHSTEGATHWFHFDAKYRVDDVTQLFGDNPATEEAQARYATELKDAERDLRSARADLLKMHAYKDAIRQSAGAYILYPGGKEEQFRQSGEIFPGLGAFPLRPVASGEAEGTAAILTFLEQALDRLGSA